MECPNGCGDMEQLVSVGNELDEATEELTTKALTIVYERCRKCGHEETIDVEEYDN